LLQTNNHASTPPLSFLQAGCPSCHPTNSIKALKAYLIPRKNGAKLKLLFHRSYDTAGWMTGRATRLLERSLMKKLEEENGCLNGSSDVVVAIYLSLLNAEKSTCARWVAPVRVPTPE